MNKSKNSKKRTREQAGLSQNTHNPKQMSKKNKEVSKNKGISIVTKSVQQL